MEFNKLTELDLSPNTALMNINCSGNKLTTLILTGIGLLDNLDCSDNSLTNLDLSRDSNSLTELTCNNNSFSFASLPIVNTSTVAYTYASQKKVEIAENIEVGQELDLSNEYDIDGNYTTYIWKTEGGTELIVDTDYSITNGVTTFLKAQTEAVYCELTNATFPDLTGINALKTTLTNVSPITNSENGTFASIEVTTSKTGNSITVISNSMGSIEIYNLSGKKVIAQNANLGSTTIYGTQQWNIHCKSHYRQ